jgi:ribosomal protein S18 acetylase RimI-like enzyme
VTCDGTRPTFRPFEPDDLPALQRVRAAAFEPVFRSFRDIVGEEIGSIAFAHAEAEQAKLLEDICGAGSGHHVLVATIEDAVVGFASFSVDADKRIGEIGLNAVHPEHAGRGVGTALYEQILTRMRALGAAIASRRHRRRPEPRPRTARLRQGRLRPGDPSLWLYKLL